MNFTSMECKFEMLIPLTVHCPCHFRVSKKTKKLKSVVTTNAHRAVHEPN